MASWVIKPTKYHVHWKVYSALYNVFIKNIP